MRNKLYSLYSWVIAFLIILPTVSCKKWIEIPPPKTTITTKEVFQTDKQAEGALFGIYSKMINTKGEIFTHDAAGRSWAAGLSCMLGGFSSDEFYESGEGSEPASYVYSRNRLTASTADLSNTLWVSAYESIYGANSVIEGIDETDSDRFPEAARNEIKAEAKFVRALAYFYLVNFFGDVPLVLTVDFNKVIAMPRTPSDKVYAQIVEDLDFAVQYLREDYSRGNGERIRPNKWAAAALLARVYLYLKDYPNAYKLADNVISQTDLYAVESDLNSVFNANSQEAIWQLKQTFENTTLGYATPYGYKIGSGPTLGVKYRIYEEFIDVLEPGDKRRSEWIGESDQTNSLPTPTLAYYINKYKISMHNRFTVFSNEYFMVLRLAEVYLIRAEAQVYGAGNGLNGAVDDLNIIRRRAGLGDLSYGLSKDELVKAVAQERRVELFGEWAHRWFDLKRTGRAQEELTKIAIKTPWEGNYQLLYPIPKSEIQENSNLIQNNGYID